jgi:Ca2+-binding RTX toxin-like protein
MAGPGLERRDSDHRSFARKLRRGNERTRNPNFGRLLVERLEERTLLSLASLVGNRLEFLAGPGEPNVAQVALADGLFTITDSAPLGAGNGCNQSGSAVSCSASGITLISASLGDLNDTITISAAISASVDGGSGDDSLIGGSAADTLLGGSGDDTLKGRSGDDQLSGGEGNDTIGETGYSAVSVPFQDIDLYGPGPVPPATEVAGATSILMHNNDGFFRLDLANPDRFSLFGSTYTTLFVSDNGVISFGSGLSGSLARNNTSLTSPSQALIGPLWDDWKTNVTKCANCTGLETGDVSNRDRVLYRIEDRAVNGIAGRWLIIEWHEVYSGSVTSNDAVTFQAILELNTPGVGRIVFSYRDVVASSSASNGALATIGIKDAGSGTNPAPARVRIAFNGQDDAGNTLLVQDGSAFLLESIVGSDVLVESGDVDFALSNTSLTGMGTDTLIGVSRVRLTGGANDNTLTAATFGGSVTLDGAGGNDLLTASSTGAVLLGGAGSDTLIGGTGSDSLDGGDDIDRVVQSGDANQTLTSTQLTGLGTDSLAHIEEASLTGGSGANTLDAGAFGGAVTLDGASGNDTLVGGSGNDCLIGGTGTDRVLQTVAGSPTLSDSQITGRGSDGLASVEEAHLVGGSGNDIISAVAFTGATTLDGADGDDLLTGGAGADCLVGGAGDDLLNGGLGGDSMVGGAGNDQLVEMGDVSFTLSNTSLTGLGSDTISDIELARLTGGAGHHTIDAALFSGSVTLDGAGGNDTLVGGSGADSLLGGAGDDSIRAGAGADTVDGSAGNDTILGEDGEDLLMGAADSDTVDGGSGDDLLRGIGDSAAETTATDDFLQGGPGNDLLEADAGNDQLAGGSGNDRFVYTAGWGIDTLVELAGEGSDVLDFRAAGVAVGVAVDAVLGLTLNSGANGLRHDQNAIESLLLGAGADTLSFGAAAQLAGGAGSLDAGPGDDTISYAAYTSPVTMDLGAGTATGLAGFAGIEGAAGGSSEDTLQGKAAANAWTITAPNAGDIDGTFRFAGFEHLAGGAAADTFDVRPGATVSGRVDGGGGVNTLSFSSFVTGRDVQLTGDGTSGTLADLTIGSGFGNIASLVGSAGSDVLRGTNAATTWNLTGANAGTTGPLAFSAMESLVGGDAADTFVLAAAASFTGAIAGQAGNDTVSYAAHAAAVNVNLALGTATAISGGVSQIENVIGGSGNDSLVGSSGANVLTGNSGSDSLDGGSGADSLLGGAGDDLLRGGPDDDTLLGDVGSDRLTESADADLTLTDTSLAGLGNDSLAAIEAAILTGSPAPNTLDASSFSGSVTLVGGDGNDVLRGTARDDSLDGGNGDDRIEISLSDDVVAGGLGTDTVEARGGPADDVLSLVVPPDVEVLTLFGDAGSDRFTVAASAQVVVLADAGPGNDAFDLSGVPGAVFLSGGPGSDTLSGGLAADFLDGGPGTDSLAGNAGNDTLQGSQDGDVISGGDGNDSLVATLDAAAETATANDTLLGGAGDDTLEGSPGDDALAGDADSDLVIQTVDANQTLSNSLLTGLGNDTTSGLEWARLTGGASDNTIDASGFGGAATLSGGDGADLLRGGTGADSISGGAGNDTLSGGPGDDVLAGGDGTDLLTESGDTNFSLSDSGLIGLGSDLLSGVDVADLSGGPANNTIVTTAFSGAATLRGASGNDSLVAGNTADVLDGGPGNDTLTGSGGNDTIMGGGDSDQVRESADTSFVLTATSLAGMGNDSLTGVTQAVLTGGPGHNSLHAASFNGSVTLDGGSGNDLLVAGPGSDCLLGGDGDDSVTGAAGSDHLAGGTGTDRLIESVTGPLTLTDSTMTGLGNDTLSGFEQAGITGDAGPNTLDGSGFSGELTLLGGGGNDCLLGGNAADTLNGGPGSDTLSGGPGNDTLDGETEQDSLVGGPGSDFLAGGFGDDTLVGDAGGDTLLGDAGNDRLTDDTLAGNNLDGGTGCDIVNGVLDGSCVPDIVVSPTSLETNEKGGSGSFTIVLNTQPTGDVTIALNSSDATEGTVSPGSVTFTPANWDTPQTVTVMGLDDLADDGDVPFSVVTAPAVSADGNYHLRNGSDVAVTNKDDDIPGIAVSPTSGLVTTEAGGTATFDVVLNTVPSANVVIALSSSDLSEGFVSAPTLTFTPENALQPQTVTVTGADDTLIDRAVSFTVITATASSLDASYHGLNASDVAVTNQDDDFAGFVISPSSSLVTAEPAGTAEFTVRLAATPAADVTIALSSSDLSEGTVSPASLTFTPLNALLPQIVTVRVVDDRAIDGTVPYTIVLARALSADTNFNGLDPNDVSVSTTDNDVASVTVSAASVTVSEPGTTATFTIALDAQPSQDVRVRLVSSRPEEAGVAPSLLTFTPTNWETAQTVTVTGVDDPVADGPATFTIFTTIETSDANFAPVNPPDVAGTNLDDDQPAIRVTPTMGLNTTEGGGTAAFAVVLATRPVADVHIAVSSSNPTEGTVSTNLLVFTPENAGLPQSVIVRGVDDPIIDRDQPYTVILGRPTSDDGNYSAIDPPDVSVTNRDDDRAEIVITGATLVTTEAGGAAEFTLALTSTPTATVTLPLAVSDATEASLSLPSVSFTPENALQPRTVTVRGLPDVECDGAMSYQIGIGPADSLDPNYQGITAPPLSGTNQDTNEFRFVVTPERLQVSESPDPETGNASSAVFSVMPTCAPPVPVTIALSSSNSAEGTVSPSSLTFMPGGGLSAQQATVTGADDPVDDGDQDFTIVTAAAQGDVDVPDVRVTNIDNDTAQVLVEAMTSLVTTESGGEARIRVRLATQPVQPVSIIAAVVAGQPPARTLASVPIQPLVFTPANDIDFFQELTITGVDDQFDEGDEVPYMVRLTAQSGDPRYHLMERTVSLVSHDDDQAQIVVEPTQLHTSEAGAVDRFSVRLQTIPLRPVTVKLSFPLDEARITAASPSEQRFNGLRIVFGADRTSVDIPVTLEVGGQDDPEVDPEDYSIRLEASSDDAAYNSTPQRRVIASLNVSNDDNDMAAVIIIPSAELTTTEAGGRATVSVGLGARPRPGSGVTVTLQSSDPTAGTVTPASIAFTAEDFSPRIVTITGRPDGRDGAVPYELVASIAVTANTDPAYAQIDPVRVPVTNLPLLLVPGDPGGLLVTAFDLGRLGAELPPIHETIGDLGGPTPDPSDVDLYRFTLDRRAVLVADMDSTSRRDPPPLDAVLQILDGQGRLLNRAGRNLVSDFGEDPHTGIVARDPTIQAVLEAGTYFLAVSSYANADYSVLSASGAGGTSTGDYVLNLAALFPVSTDVSHNTVATARPVPVDARAVRLLDRLNAATDQDVFSLDLTADQILTADVDSIDIGLGSVRTTLQLFGPDCDTASAGNPLAASPLRRSATQNPATQADVRDALLVHPVSETGTYCLVVAAPADSPFGGPSDYQLTIRRFPVELRPDQPDAPTQNIDPIALELGKRLIVQESVSPERDVDFFRVELKRDDILSVRVEPTGNETDLSDALLRLFRLDAAGEATEVLRNDFTFDRFTGLFQEHVSELELVATADATYLIGVSDGLEEQPAGGSYRLILALDHSQQDVFGVTPRQWVWLRFDGLGRSGEDDAVIWPAARTAPPLDVSAVQGAPTTAAERAQFRSGIIAEIVQNVDRLFPPSLPVDFTLERPATSPFMSVFIGGNCNEIPHQNRLFGTAQDSERRFARVCSDAIRADLGTTPSRGLFAREVAEIIAHEVAHNFNLVHVAAENDIMNDSSDGVNPEAAQFSDDEVETLKATLGGESPPALQMAPVFLTPGLRFAIDGTLTRASARDRFDLRGVRGGDRLRVDLEGADLFRTRTRFAMVLRNPTGQEVGTVTLVDPDTGPSEDPYLEYVFPDGPAGAHTLEVTAALPGNAPVTPLDGRYRLRFELSTDPFPPNPIDALNSLADQQEQQSGRSKDSIRLLRGGTGDLVFGPVAVNLPNENTFAVVESENGTVRRIRVVTNCAAGETVAITAAGPVAAQIDSVVVQPRDATNTHCQSSVLNTLTLQGAEVGTVRIDGAIQRLEIRPGGVRSLEVTGAAGEVHLGDVLGVVSLRAGARVLQVDNLAAGTLLEAQQHLGQLAVDTLGRDSRISAPGGIGSAIFHRIEDAVVQATNASKIDKIEVQQPSTGRFDIAASVGTFRFGGAFGRAGGDIERRSYVAVAGDIDHFLATDDLQGALFTTGSIKCFQFFDPEGDDENRPDQDDSFRGTLDGKNGQRGRRELAAGACDVWDYEVKPGIVTVQVFPVGSVPATSIPIDVFHVATGESLLAGQGAGATTFLRDNGRVDVLVDMALLPPGEKTARLQIRINNESSQPADYDIAFTAALALQRSTTDNSVGLTIAGTRRPEQITVTGSRRLGSVTIRDESELGEGEGTQRRQTRYDRRTLSRLANAPIRPVVVRGRGGNDTITVADRLEVPIKVQGDGGADRIRGKSIDTINGGAGIDTCEFLGAECESTFDTVPSSAGHRRRDPAPRFTEPPLVPLGASTPALAAALRVDVPAALHRDTIVRLPRTWQDLVDESLLADDPLGLLPTPVG